jgi:hypothetical protein
MKIELKTMIGDVLDDKVKGNFSKDEAIDSIRQELIAANGGSERLTPKTFRDHPEMFQIVETLIDTIVDKSLSESNPLFESLVEYRNIAAGDVNEFVSKPDSDFVFADTAAGISGVRRQRLSGGERLKVPTEVKSVRVYDVLGRFLSGRITFDELVTKVAEEYQKRITSDIYKTTSSITANTPGLSAEFMVTGAFDEDVLSSLIDKVEASTGMPAKIIGPRSALRKIRGAVLSNEAKTDLYQAGYLGKYEGTPLIQLRNAWDNTKNAMVLDDNKIYIIASQDKPIKFVREGSPLFSEKAFGVNADQTQEYFYSDIYGVGLILSSRFGVYEIS